MKDAPRDKTPLERAIDVAGSLKDLADKLGVTPQVVVNWRKRGNVPPDRVLAIEIATDGRVNRSELRPDLYPPSDMEKAA